MTELAFLVLQWTDPSDHIRRTVVRQVPLEVCLAVKPLWEEMYQKIPVLNGFVDCLHGDAK